MYKNIDFFSAEFYVRFAIYLENMNHPNLLCGLEHRLIYNLNGETIVQVNNTKITLSRRDMLIISAGVPYKIISSSGAIFFYYFDLTYENSHIKSRVLPVKTERFREKDLLCNYKLEIRGETFDYLHVKTVYGVSDILLSICKYNDYKDEYFEKYKSSLLMAAVSKAFFSYDNKKQSKIVELIKGYVSENFDKDISIADVANSLSYHESYINRIIKRETALSFHKYLVTVRLNKALNLLTSGYDISVEEVALKVGFKDPKYFATCFKKHYGISPSKSKNI